jgi:hypothetical protein
VEPARALLLLVVTAAPATLAACVLSRAAAALLATKAIRAKMPAGVGVAARCALVVAEYASGLHTGSRCGDRELASTYVTAGGMNGASWQASKLALLTNRICRGRG